MKTDQQQSTKRAHKRIITLVSQWVGGGHALALVLFTSCMAAPVFGQQSHGPVIVGAPVTPVKVTVKPEPPTTTEPIASGEEVTVPEGEPLPTVPPPPPTPIIDPVFQQPIPKLRKSDQTTEAVSPPIVNFPGLSTTASPPDTTGDVGPNHYIQMVNATSFKIWDKAGNALTGTQNHGNLFSPAEGNLGDPIVVYDHLADRWVLTQFFATGMLFAISQTADPTAGTWYTYKFTTGAGLPDYPKIGVWGDAYYVSTFESPDLGIYAFDRAKMVAGLAAGFVKTTISALTPTAGIRNTRILPADLDGPAPPAGTPGYFVRTVDGQQDTSNPTDRVEIYEAIVNWTGPTFSFPLVNTLSPAAFNVMVGNRNGGGVRDMIPMPNSDGTVDGLSNRPMMQLKYRYFAGSPKMVFCQTIDIQGSIFPLLGFTPTKEVAGIRWYQLDKPGASWTIGQQGTFGDQPGVTTESQLLHRWMGSAAINAAGDIAIAYSISNDDNAKPVYPGIRYTGRRASDPAGTLPQGEDVIQHGVNSRGPALGQRWGDYSQMGVDPSDETTFWFTNHDANYNTRIASFNVTGDDLFVPGALTFSANGLVGGPFNPTHTTYTLTNTGAASLNWTASKTQPWTTLSSTGGTLLPGASTTVICSFNAAANALALGSYSDVVTITNTASGFARTFNVTLNVLATLPGVPATVLPNDNSTSANARAPMTRYRFERTVYLITPAEMAASGFANGTVPQAIGWTYQTAPGHADSAPLKVYLQNTADTTNTKSTIWATAISGMTLAHDATTTLPNVTGAFDIPFSGGSPFTYTGGGLYVAFDWGNYTGTLSTTCVALCNSAGLVNGLLGAQSTSSAPTTLAASSFRPETRLIAPPPPAPAPGINVQHPLGTSLVDGTASIDFGTVTAGSSSAAKTFTITNTGTADLASLAVTIDGANPGEFSVSALSGGTLVPVGSGNVSFTVTFNPPVGSSGAKTAAIHIGSNVAGAQNPFDITVTGTASNPAVTQLGVPSSVFADSDTLAGFTVPAGVDRLLVVTASGVKATDVTAVTFNGVAMTQAVEQTDNFAVDSIWVLPMGTSASSVTGPITIATNSVASPNERYISGVVFGGVNQTTPTSSPQSSFASSNTRTLTVTSAPGDLVYDVMDAYDDTSLPSITLTSGQTLVTEKTTSVAVFTPGYPSGGFQRNANSSKPGSASVTMSWTSNVTGALIHVAINIKSAAGPVSLPAPVAGPLGDVITAAFAPDGTGANDTTKFDMLRRGGFLAQNGSIVFPGFLEIGVGGVTEMPNTFYGIWKAVGGSVTRLARAGDNAPETGLTIPTAAKFDILPEVPAINDAGQVTLLASLAASGASTPPTTIANDTGLWSELGGTGLQILIREDDDIPGLPAGTKVGRFGSGCFATADTGGGTGEAAFVVTMKGASTDSALLRCSITGATLTAVGVVARENAPAPGLAGDVFDVLNGSYTDAVRMDAAGNIAFGASVKPSYKSALWYQPVTGGAPVKAIATGETAPGTSGATFFALEIPAMGSGGTFAFHGYLNPGTGDNTGNARNSGIWRGSVAGGFSAILRRGDTAVAGLPPGAKVGNLWNGWLTNGNRGAWKGWVDLAGDGISPYPADSFGIYTDTSGTMALLIKSGDAAPSIAGATLLFIDHPVCGGVEQVAFLGTVTGLGVTIGSNDKGLWRTAANGGALSLVLRTGDSMTTSQGVKTIADIDLPGSNLSELRWEQPVMDSTGRLLVYVTFTDGSSAQVLVP